MPRYQKAKTQRGEDASISEAAKQLRSEAAKRDLDAKMQRCEEAKSVLEAAKQLRSEAAKRDLEAKMPRCEEAKSVSEAAKQLRSEAAKCNILISPLEGEKKFLSELCELRNFREGYKKYKYSDRATYSPKHKTLIYFANRARWHGAK